MARRSLSFTFALALLLIPVFSFSRVGSLVRGRAPPSPFRDRPPANLPSCESASQFAAARDDDSERMDLVRSLQKTFYKNGADAQSVSFDSSTGMVCNLPLWRVGWVETPGRRNCLNVHEPKYTHMFESIMSSPSGSGPRYFGHLHCPGGTKSIRSGEERYTLKSYDQELEDESRFDNFNSTSTLMMPDIRTPTVDRSAVVGCLCEILDLRRMEDGRLMILTQALERFVVSEVASDQKRLYDVANVQILLDEEELPWDQSKEIDENFCKPLRGKAVKSSFRYHKYEYDRPTLPVSDSNVMGGENYVTQDEVPLVKISEMLPFSRYNVSVEASSSLDDANEKAIGMIKSVDAASFEGGELPLERILWNGGIVWNPPSVTQVVRRDNLNCDQLETLLWLSLEDFSRASGFVLPEEVRQLVPPEMDYLDIPRPERILSSRYPKTRRQKRLSYLAPALIENLEHPFIGLRQVWLNCPSIAARLNGALERYDYLNNKMLGRFE
ncbi:hypothetical protein THAOC_00530 [Thalassiosira oceanica]|uniref:Lon N-terminal domain-containing protein n=1 Tax=Thalassiosira oceanica TaxID=159749 RepID=K0TP39_THAOC|nr:hypothetical protein THAOC_00530 [Thalassiosira oceanica]|eukprot:EJK77626.1 hypothetical protein THAOC_00530 [Thalassiosira oceanica]